MTTPVLDVSSFQGRDDDVVLNSTTFNGGGAMPDTDWSQAVDINFRIRFLIDETAGGMNTNENFTLHADLGGAGFFAVTNATTIIVGTLTDHYANGDTTTQVLGAATYVSDESLGGVEEAGVTGNIDYGGNDQAECEFCIQIVGADVNDLDTIVFKLVDDAAVDVPETVTCTVTVSKPSASMPLFNRPLKIWNQPVTRF